MAREGARPGGLAVRFHGSVRDTKEPNSRQQASTVDSTMRRVANHGYDRSHSFLREIVF
jgi:hypothetical protein